jgi:alpha-tubulin suppressor-like RCC1 family protein
MRSHIWFATLVAAAACGEAADAPTGPAAAPALATAAVPLSFRQVDEGYEHTCGVTTDDRAYCWGDNEAGQLGDGTKIERHTPVAVAGGLTFRHVSTGIAHACGLTTVNKVYCWGDNFAGQIGDSTTATRLKPVLVYGGRRYRQVRAGNQRTCALTTDSLAYCWGSNLYGALGIGSTTIKRRLYPVKVAGGLTFELLNGGNFHVCGLTAAGKAYCWGSNEDGRLGDGTTVDRSSPRAVAGGRVFQTVTAGGLHSCALGTNDRAYCWGGNPDGQLGDGTTSGHLTPTAVAGGLLFAGVTADRGRHTCGVTLDHKTYCWGSNSSGQLGDGSFIDRLSPKLVGGRVTFVGVTGGSRHTCAVASVSHAAYCWGFNANGELGDGSTSTHALPVPVAGPN